MHTSNFEIRKDNDSANSRWRIYTETAGARPVHCVPGSEPLNAFLNRRRRHLKCDTLKCHEGLIETTRRRQTRLSPFLSVPFDSYCNASLAAMSQ